MNILFVDGEICKNKEKTAVENAAEIRKEFEDFKENITDKFAKSKLESRSGIADCKGEIAVIHGIFEEQDKKIKALEEKIDNLAGYTEKTFLELNKRHAANSVSISELKHRLAKSDKTIYTKYSDNEGGLYYKCGNCHTLMTILGDDILYCPECKIDVLK